MKKVLVYFHEKYMTPSGGPSGYLYNLKTYLEKTGSIAAATAGAKEKEGTSETAGAPVDAGTGATETAGARSNKSTEVELYFLNDRDFHSSISFKMKNAAHRVFRSDRSLSDVGKRVGQIFFESEQEGPYDLSRFDAVHFHSTADMFTQKKNLEHYEGKVILTSHTPKAPHLEWIEDMAGAGGRPHDPDGRNDAGISEKERALLASTKEWDEYAFSRADYLIFPCREAEEPYFHTWEDYPKFRKEEKIFYLPTGTGKRVPKKTRQQIRKELHIPEENFVICFVGRHNSVKGYDRLKEIFQELQNRRGRNDLPDLKDTRDLAKFPEVTVLCCGREGAIAPPSSGNWIEAGWTDDAASYVQAADLFILPNKETYFDLAFLETMSIGKTSLLSKTGGNKVFSGMEDRGIYLFDTKEDAISLIYRIMNEDPVVREEKEEAQRVLFEKEYAMEKFVPRYMEILEKILRADGENRNT